MRLRGIGRILTIVFDRRCYVLGDLLAQFTFEEVEAEIDARRYPPGRDDVAGVDHPVLTDLGAGLPEIPECRFVGHSGFSIQDSGGRHEHRPRTYASDNDAGIVESIDGDGEVTALGLGKSTRLRTGIPAATGNHENIRIYIRERSVDRECDPVTRGDGFDCIQRDEGYLDRCPRVSRPDEHAIWPEDVEFVHPVEAYDRNVHDRLSRESLLIPPRSEYIPFTRHHAQTMSRRLRRDGPVAIIGAVSVAHFLSHVYLLAFPPLFPILGNYFGLSTTQLGLLVTAIYLPTLLLQLPLGIVVDRIGAKRVLVGGLFLTSAAIGLSGFAPNYSILLLLALISGIGQSVFHPADYAFLDAVTDSSTEGKAFSAHTFGGYAGFAAAPAVIGGIGIAIDWRVALTTVGVVGITYTAAFALFTPPVYARSRDTTETTETSQLRDTLRRMADYAREWDLLAVAIFYLLSMTAIVGLQSFTTVLAVESYGFTDSAANTLLTAHLTATAIGVLLGGPIADRLPFQSVITIALLVCAGGVWLAAVGPWGAAFIAPLVVFVVVGLVLGAALPSRDRLANSTGDPDATGARFGFFFTGVSMGAVVAPAVLGWIIDVWSADHAFLVVGISLVASAAVPLMIFLAGERSARARRLA